MAVIQRVAKVKKLDFTSLYPKQHKVVPFLITRLLDYHF